MIAHPTQPVALTIAGSDSSGGAGIQADLKTFAVLEVTGTSAITAVTAQNMRGVSGIHAVPPQLIAQQIASVAEEFEIKAIKTGMLGNSATVEAVVEALADLRAPQSTTLVVDPVMVATSGAILMDSTGINAVRNGLLKVADLVTPNLNEAAILLDTLPATTEAEMAHQARALLATGALAVLLKGGHLGDASAPPKEASDVLVTDAEEQWFRAPFIVTDNTHGTGCTLSAAITAERAKGTPLATAVARGKAFVTDALKKGAV